MFTKLSRFAFMTAIRYLSKNDLHDLVILDAQESKQKEMHSSQLQSLGDPGPGSLQRSSARGRSLRRRSGEEH